MDDIINKNHAHVNNSRHGNQAKSIPDHSRTPSSQQLTAEARISIIATENTPTSDHSQYNELQKPLLVVDQESIEKSKTSADSWKTENKEVTNNSAKLLIENGAITLKSGEYSLGKCQHRNGLENPEKVAAQEEAEEPKKKDKMAYDDVILHMGAFGRYQRRIYFLLCLPAISCALHKMAGVFLGAKSESRCFLPDIDYQHNVSFMLPIDIMNNSYPRDGKPWSQCTRWVDNGNGSRIAKKCESFVYDRSRYKSTTTSEWNLVCDDSWLRGTGDSIFMVGVMLGSMVFGALSDKYGRRPIFFLSLVIQLVGGILVAASPEYISYMIFRLIVGSTTSGVFLVAYVIALEMVGPKKRLVAGVGCQLFFTAGYIMTAGFAYFITDWRILQIAITIPSIVFLLYWWFIPESARWLLTKGRTQEAKELLQKASLENGVELSRDTLDGLLSNDNDSTPDTKKASLFDLFRYPNLRRKSILIFFNWFANSGTYYGLSWNAFNLEGNEYLNFVISGAVEVPAYTFLIFTLNRWGRKIILCGCMLIAGISLILTVFVPDDLPWLTVVLVNVAKLTITASYGAIYVFTAEQFPTVIRNVGLGASSTFARVGGVIAPCINSLSEVWKPLPFVIFGTCTLFGGVMSLLLPETLGKKLPESIQDGELFGKKIKKKKFDVEQLNDVEVTKPLKQLENGVHEKQNG